MDIKNCHTAVKGEEIEKAIESWDGNIERKHKYDFNGTCPDCGSSRWKEGPTSRMNVNIKCESCGSKFNYHPLFEEIERIG